MAIGMYRLNNGMDMLWWCISRYISQEDKESPIPTQDIYISLYYFYQPFWRAIP